jgi:hypothetical protein
MLYVYSDPSVNNKHINVEKPLTGMSTIRKFMVFGPMESLERMSQTFLEGTTPQYTFRSVQPETSHRVDVMVYEEHHKLKNSSLSVTLIMECTGRAVKVDIVTTGGKMGFRGSNPEGDDPINESITDMVLDYAKRFGLTIQEVNERAAQAAE